MENVKEAILRLCMCIICLLLISFLRQLSVSLRHLFPFHPSPFAGRARLSLLLSLGCCLMVFFLLAYVSFPFSRLFVRLVIASYPQEGREQTHRNMYTDRFMETSTHLLVPSHPPCCCSSSYTTVGDEVKVCRPFAFLRPLLRQAHFFGHDFLPPLPPHVCTILPPTAPPLLLLLSPPRVAPRRLGKLRSI